jgi:hypothetical protein
MAFNSSSSSTASAILLQPIFEKLTRANFPVWKALVMSALRGAQLHQFLDGKTEFPEKELTLEDKKMKIPNPDYVRVAAKEQQVLNYLLSSLSRDSGAGGGLLYSRRSVGVYHIQFRVSVSGSCNQCAYGVVNDQEG